MKNTWKVKPIKIRTMKINFNLDSDRDGVKDKFDCRPFNPFLQDSIFKNEDENFVKVILDDYPGNYEGSGEGIWVYLAYGNEDKGVGFLSNQPFNRRAKFGDIVAFISPHKTMRAHIVSILSHSFLDNKFENMTKDDINKAITFYKSKQSLLNREVKKMETSVCAVCGTKDMHLWMTSNEEWKEVVPPNLRGELICKKCFEKMKRGKI